MSKVRVWTVCCFVLVLAGMANAQRGKAGLWEITSSMTMSGGPMNVPQMPPRTSQVCVSQAMVDKYGGPTTSPGRGNCQMTNVVVTATGMTANMSCSGQMNMTGTVQTTFVDANTTKSTIHMTMTTGNGQTMTTTTESTSTYKGPDCGSVQPLPMPTSK
jgi:hypothetical protein